MTQNFNPIRMQVLASAALTRWDINWGDGSDDTYAAGVVSASHVYTQTGYRAPAQPLVISGDGVSATPSF